MSIPHFTAKTTKSQGLNNCPRQQENSAQYNHSNSSVKKILSNLSLLENELSPQRDFYLLSFLRLLLFNSPTIFFSSYYVSNIFLGAGYNCVNEINKNVYPHEFTCRECVGKQVINKQMYK